MGYQAGQGLGSSAPGTSVPIDVVLKTTKAGLGVDEGKNRKRREAEIARSASGDKPSIVIVLLLLSVHNQSIHAIPTELTVMRMVLAELKRAKTQEQSQVAHE
jgi:hypothetical protein